MSNKPTHYLSVVSGTGEKSRFTEIAPLWPTEKGNLSGTIPEGVSITGRFVITAAKSAAGDNDGGQP